MRIPGVKTARLTGRRLLGRLRGGAAILGYHRISEDTWDPFGVGVSVESFRQQMEALVEHARVVALEDLVADRASANRRRRAVAVTFDDAYLECATEVAPVLERLEIPATVFAISGSLGREPWWEKLARALGPDRRLSVPCELEVDGVCLSTTGREVDSPAARKQLCIEVHRQLSALGSEHREEVLASLCELLEVESAGAEHRCLTEGELRELGRSKVVRIGAHGHRHVELARLSAEEQRREIEGSKEILEQALEQPVEGFSYPHGSWNDVTPRLVREAGFVYGCCSFPATVLVESEPYRLPRLWAPNLSGDRFWRWLSGWIGR